MESNLKPITYNKEINYISSGVSLFVGLNNGLTFINHGDLFNLVKCILTILLSYLFLERSSALVTSSKLKDVIISVTHVIIPVFLTKSELSIIPRLSGYLLIFSGTTISTLGFFNLWKNFGVLPSLREVTSQGIYQYIRHPIYLGYLVSIAGWILMNISTMNLILLLLYLPLTILRMYAEENILSTSLDYQAYSVRVRARIIPWLI